MEYFVESEDAIIDLNQIPLEDILVQGRKNICKCGKTASYGLPGTKKRVFCRNCKLPGYIYLIK